MKRLLFIAHRLPYPPDKGERVRAFHQLRLLARQFQITLAAQVAGNQAESAAKVLQQYAPTVLVGNAGGRCGLAKGSLSLLTRKSVTQGYFRSRSLERQVRAACRQEPFDLVFAYSSSTLELALSVPARGRIMDLVDVDSQKWQAYADQARGPRRWLYRAEARGVGKLEKRAVEEFDAVILVSADEADAFHAKANNVHAITNGVDLDFFQPEGDPDPDNPSVVFTGSMDYRPNIDAVCWFARHVWPKLRGKVPNLQFYIVGRDPVPQVAALAGSPGIVVTGPVEDVRPYLQQATMAVAPLRIARGIQNKVLEAMAMARPVLASPAALEGIQARAETEICLADQPEQWVRCALNLLADPERAIQIGRSARQRVQQDYSWDRCLSPLVRMAVELSTEGGAAEPVTCNKGNAY